MEPFKIGRYEATAEIGRGGMATVYRAYDPDFEREVAIKILPREFMHDPTFYARFKREVKIIGALEHVAIVPVYDFGEQDGQPYMVMRLMLGGSLEERIRAGRFSLAEAVRILTLVAPILDQAHARGVIHRDLKPSNILFDQHDKPFLADFGIARLMKGPTLTSQYATVGTPAYMSPEQGRGDPDIDAQSDIYSFGAILFEILSGRVPYEAETPTGQIIKHITDPIPNILELRDDLPPDCQALINRAMAKKKSDRFATMAEMAQMLSIISQGRTLPRELVRPAIALIPEADALPPKGSPPVSLPRLFKRFPVWLWAIVSAFLLLGLLAVIGLIGIPAVFPKSKPTSTLTALPLPSATQEIATAVPSPTFTSKPTLPPTYTRIATVTPTHTRTATFPPTYTRIPSSPTASTTLQLLAVVKVDSANVRTGPGIVYPVDSSYKNGTQLQVVGRNTDGAWLVILLPGQTRTGWISLSTVEVSFEVMGLPVVAAPPAPTPKPTSTPTQKPANPYP